MVVDAFTHALTERFYRTLTEEYSFQGLSGTPSFLWEVEPRIEAMDEYGIDKQVLTLALPPIFRDMDPDTALEVVRLANDEIRRMADEHPDRFIATGTIPYVTDGFMDEFDRCIEELDMAGIQIFSNFGGEPLDRPEFHPIYERAESHDVPLWIHPQLFDWHDWADEYDEHRLFWWPFETTLAMTRLVMGGVMEEYDLDVVTHHMGGMTSFYAGRIDSFYRTRLEFPENYGLDLPDFSKPLTEYFADFYADTAVGGHVPAHECGRAFFGDDRLVFGTDYPFGPERGREFIETGLAGIDGMDLEEAARERILRENALELVA